ncbi:hypothetical protein D8674_018495 [Pyrus ussuriensis x Pyrus communis]|uniref:Uncharacterized protein n=1 Tax=Pyrus ussuriensis x Pyrus communis TaxID=2448454 RepID=A0A5N5G560_9ROSA|nr:hypothetical protein D8674_018495 [Pyrus ussuriensis x Pyrus communis]
MGRWKFQKHSEGASANKRRRRGSRSISGRSSEWSGTRRCCSVRASAGRYKGGGREWRVAGMVHEVFSCKLDILGVLIETG